MAYVRMFARSRVVRLIAALCAVSMLAFVLGQGAAALRENLAAPRQAAVQTQILERVTGAQGVARPTSTPTATGVRSPTTKPDEFSTDASHSPEARPLTPQPPLQEDKHHHSHKKAAGDASHGGLGHEKRDKRHNDGAPQDAQSHPNQQDQQNTQDQQGKHSQQGVGKSND